MGLLCRMGRSLPGSCPRFSQIFQAVKKSLRIFILPAVIPVHEHITPDRHPYGTPAAARKPAPQYTSAPGSRCRRHRQKMSPFL